MDIQARINELTGQQQSLMQQQQEWAVNIQRLAGAIAILTEQLAEDNIPEVGGELQPSTDEMEETLEA